MVLWRDETRVFRISGALHRGGGAVAPPSVMDTALSRPSVIEADAAPTDASLAFCRRQLVHQTEIKPRLLDASLK